jgi:hypothetical protein
MTGLYLSKRSLGSDDWPPAAHALSRNTRVGLPIGQTTHPQTEINRVSAAGLGARAALLHSSKARESRPCGTWQSSSSGG